MNIVFITEVIISTRKKLYEIQPVCLYNFQSSIASEGYAYFYVLFASLILAGNADFGREYTVKVYLIYLGSHAFIIFEKTDAIAVF